MGELHLEIITYRINEKGVEIETSEPIVVYRETIAATAGPVEGKSPNKHNKFYIEIEPLEDNIFQAIQNGDIKEGRVKGKDLIPKLVELGLEKDQARKVWDINNRSLLINSTRGIQYLDEIKELLMEGFESALDDGPIAREKVMGIKIKLMDAKIHEDAVHRGPAQVLPAIRKAVYGSIMLAEPTLLEPVQKVFINVPQDYMGSSTREVQNRRGQIVDMSQEGDMATLESKVPVAEMFGFAGDIRSAAEGRCLWSTENAGFERLPRELQKIIIKEIRQRKGLTPDPYGPDHYIG
jgi:elongation factor 2